MRFSASAVATAALMAGSAIAEPLTTITPCAGATSTTAPLITVTKQYQSVSTCATTSACFRGACVTKYPFETFAYVNTAIPCAWDGESAETTTVTATTQEVVISRFHKTITQTVTPTITVTVNGTTSLIPKPTPLYLTIAKDFSAPFNKIGPLAIPGYDGSGLCEECDTASDGSRSQVVDVVECRLGPGGSKCMGYEETWISKPAPKSSSTAVAPVSTKFVAPSAGVYTFTFPFWAPAHVVTAGAAVTTVAPSPYFVHVTRKCHRAHEVIDFTTTITKTIYFTVPCSRQPPKTSSAVPFPTGNHAFPWFPRPGGNSPIDSGKPGKGGDPFAWADWGNDNVDPTGPVPGDWADWVTETSTTTTTSYLSTSTSYLTSTTTASSTNGPISQTTTTTDGASSSSSSSSSSSAAASSSSSSSSYSSSLSSTTTASSTDGPISQTTTTTGGPSSSSSSSSSSSDAASSSSSSSSASSTSAAESTSSSITSASSTSAAESTSSSITSASSTSAAESTSSSITSASSTSAAQSSSSSITSASSTSADQSSSSSSSSSATTTTAPPATTPFFITTNTPAKYRKRAIQYIGFEGEDAVLVSDQALAALFVIDADGYLMSGGQYVDADTTQPYLAFSLSPTKSATTSKFTLNADGSLQLASPNNGFCVTPDNSVFIIFSANPPFTCNPISLVAQSPGSVTTTTTTTTTAAPTTTTATTTTSFDPSGDLALDQPTATPVRRGVQYGGRHYYHHRH